MKAHLREWDQLPGRAVAPRRHYAKAAAPWGRRFGSSGRRAWFRHANEMLWSLSGIVRMRLPVAAKNALSTAGAATKMVGSPTPPQKSLDCMMMDSTLGISLMRIVL